MVKDLTVLKDFDTAYEEAYRAWDAFYPEAETDLRFYLGDQWNIDEQRALKEEGRNAFVFNRIRPIINLITGKQRQNRLSSLVVPVEDSDQKTADQLSELLIYCMQYADMYNIISDCFGGALKTGWNLASVYMDYTDDPFDGDIRLAREPWNGFILDPFFTRLDLSDCSYVMRRKYLSPEMVATMLPEHKDEIMELGRLGYERDAKFTWLPYQRTPTGQDLLAYNEYFTQGSETKDIIVNRKNGKFEDWDGTREEFSNFKQIFPDLELATRQEKFVLQHIIVNDQVIETVKNPYGLNEFPFVPFVSIWEPESDDWSLKCQSYIRALRDPQRESNRRRSQMSDMLDSQVNSGWIATEGSVINPQSLFQTSQGKVIWRDKTAGPGSIEKIPPAQIPPSMFQLAERYDSDIKDIAGVNDASFGLMQSGNESGVLTLLRQNAAEVAQQDLFDNLRYSQKLISQKVLKLIQTWSPEKILRIIKEEPTPEFYDKKFTKYDCVVQEGVLTDTQRQLYFKQLVDLTQLGVPVGPEELTKAAPIQAKGDLLESIQQQAQAQAQAQQMQQDLNNQLIQAQMDLAKSKSLEQIAGAKERQTRSVANLGLEDERASSAVRDRSLAVYDQIKAMKELESMDLENFQKSLLITEALSNKAQAEEEEIKSEDVLISEVSTAPQQTNLNPIQQEV